jgi:5-hydroxyisourate hydrolase
VPGRLTTHVLDTVHGRPAAGMAVSLLRVTSTGGHDILARTRTNVDGRLDAPLLADDSFQPGSYELRFETGDYWAGLGLALADPPFLDIVPVRFAVSDPNAHYHVPLLCSPWAYSTYRGS